MHKSKIELLPTRSKTKVLRSKYTWANEVLARIEYSRDLMATNSVYHQSYSIEFRLGKYPDEDCYEPLANKRKTISSRMFDIKREDAFLQAVNCLQENVKKQLTIQDLITKMDQLCESPFSFKHVKRRLLDYFGESVIITEIKGKLNIITLRSMASYIFQ